MTVWGRRQVGNIAVKLNAVARVDSCFRKNDTRGSKIFKFSIIISRSDIRLREEELSEYQAGMG
jgi:hypothetical protein